MGFGVIIIGDEILSARRQDKHLSKAIELLGQRGASLSWARYVGDDPALIESTIHDAIQSNDIVFSFGGIGATPDDHTRACAARASGLTLALHPQAETLILERSREMLTEEGRAFDPADPDIIRRLDMGRFPVGAEIIPNPYNKIPGFSLLGRMHFLPGFPVMAWPMMAWVLDERHADKLGQAKQPEKSVIVLGGLESRLTPLMLKVEALHPGIKVFSLPSVDHPQFGKHIDLGVKGAPELIEPAFQTLLAGLHELGASLGPEMVR